MSVAEFLKSEKESLFDNKDTLNQISEIKLADCVKEVRDFHGSVLNLGDSKRDKKRVLLRVEQAVKLILLSR
jgi:hypothetical protein